MLNNSLLRGLFLGVCGRVCLSAWLPALFSCGTIYAGDLEPVSFNNPGLVVDLGVGLWAWPLPMDYDGDGDNDLVVSCPDKPYNGTYFFENRSGNVALPVFQPAVRIGPGFHNIRVSQIREEYRVLTPGREYRDFAHCGFDKPVLVPVANDVHVPNDRVRAKQWTYCDYNGDAVGDLIVGIGDWKEYGWDDAFDDQGRWTRGPLRGFVYYIINQGIDAKPRYDAPVKVTVGEVALEVFGWPSPNFSDWDGDGDLDLICGEFLDKLTYFQNVGSRHTPVYAPGSLLTHGGQPIRMDLQMIVPAAIDWDRDGDVDLVVGDEDGRVALVENSGTLADSVPQFLPPQYFQQQADLLKFGALATPYSYDWDADGDEDLLCGNTAGSVGFIENLGGGERPRWASPKLLEADGKVIRIQAGENGSIQGPCEAKWGYTTLSVADWNHDRLPDLIVNSIWGEVIWYENAGTRSEPRLKSAQHIEVEWKDKPPKPAWIWWNPQGKQLVTQWRTTPAVVDFDGDGLNDLVMLDHEGYLALFARRRQQGKLVLLPGDRLFVDTDGAPLRLNPRRAGKSGRRKLQIIDWDGDGRLDLLVNSVNANLLRNVETRDGKIVLEDRGPLAARKVSGHSSSPATVDWNEDGIPDLLVAAEDGHFYYKTNPREK